MVQPSGHQTNILLEVGTNELEIITFYLRWYNPAKQAIEKVYYGINAAKVKELVAMPEEVTRVPDSPACVQGIFLLRGMTIPIIDLCQWFNYEPDESPQAREQWVLIVSEINGKPFGFITHGVDKVYRVSWAQMQSPPEMIADCQSITAVCLIDDLLIQMVDFERITAAIDPTMALDGGIESAEEALDSLASDKVVVIADDSRTILLQVKSTLEKAGYKVVSHGDGQSAWDYLENLRGQGKIDSNVLAVISDIEMPRMDGHRLCLLIKQNPAYKRIPVILFSSMINDALRRKGHSVGADDQITKPELVQLVDRLSGCIARLQG